MRLVTTEGATFSSRAAAEKVGLGRAQLELMEGSHYTDEILREESSEDF